MAWRPGQATGVLLLRRLGPGPVREWQWLRFDIGQLTDLRVHVWSRFYAEYRALYSRIYAPTYMTQTTATINSALPLL